MEGQIAEVSKPGVYKGRQRGPGKLEQSVESPSESVPQAEGPLGPLHGMASLADAQLLFPPQLPLRHRPRARHLCWEWFASQLSSRTLWFWCFSPWALLVFSSLPVIEIGGQEVLEGHFETNRLGLKQEGAAPLQRQLPSEPKWHPTPC